MTRAGARRQPNQVAVGDSQVDVADRDHVALAQRRGQDPDAVDESPVDAVSAVDPDADRGRTQAGLIAPLPGNFVEMTASPEVQEIAVITGASTGIGAATARELARRGFHVLAGVRHDRDADAIRGPGIEPLTIDITNADHIRALATRVQEDPQGRALRMLVNNAGIGVNVPVEAFAIEEWRRLFEVDIFGHIAVTQHSCRP